MNKQNKPVKVLNIKRIAGAALAATVATVTPIATNAATVDTAQATQAQPATSEVSTSPNYTQRNTLTVPKAVKEASDAVRNAVLGASDTAKDSNEEQPEKLDAASVARKNILEKEAENKAPTEETKQAKTVADSAKKVTAAKPKPVTINDLQDITKGKLPVADPEPENVATATTPATNQQSTHTAPFGINIPGTNGLTATDPSKDSAQPLDGMNGLLPITNVGNTNETAPRDDANDFSKAADQYASGQNNNIFTDAVNGIVSYPGNVLGGILGTGAGMANSLLAAPLHALTGLVAFPANLAGIPLGAVGGGLTGAPVGTLTGALSGVAVGALPGAALGATTGAGLSGLTGHFFGGQLGSLASSLLLPGDKVLGALGAASGILPGAVNSALLLPADKIGAALGALNGNLINSVVPALGTAIPNSLIDGLLARPIGRILGSLADGTVGSILGVINHEINGTLLGSLLGTVVDSATGATAGTLLGRFLGDLNGLAHLPLDVGIPRAVGHVLGLINGTLLGGHVGADVGGIVNPLKWINGALGSLLGNLMGAPIGTIIGALVNPAKWLTPLLTDLPGMILGGLLNPGKWILPLVNALPGAVIGALINPGKWLTPLLTDLPTMFLGGLINPGKWILPLMNVIPGAILGGLINPGKWLLPLLTAPLGGLATLPLSIFNTIAGSLLGAIPMAIAGTLLNILNIPGNYILTWLFVQNFISYPLTALSAALVWQWAGVLIWSPIGWFAGAITMGILGYLNPLRIINNFLFDIPVFGISWAVLGALAGAVIGFWSAPLLFFIPLWLAWLPISFVSFKGLSVFGVPFTILDQMVVGTTLAFWTPALIGAFGTGVVGWWLGLFAGAMFAIFATPILNVLAYSAVGATLGGFGAGITAFVLCGLIGATLVGIPLSMIFTTAGTAVTGLLVGPFLWGGLFALFGGALGAIPGLLGTLPLMLLGRGIGRLLGFGGGTILDAFTGAVLTLIASFLGGTVLDNLTGLLNGHILGRILGTILDAVTGGLIGNVLGFVNGTVLDNLTGLLNGHIFGRLLGTLLDALTGRILGRLIGSIAVGIPSFLNGCMKDRLIGRLLGALTGGLTGRGLGGLIGGLLGLGFNLLLRAPITRNASGLLGNLIGRPIGRYLLPMNWLLAPVGHHVGRRVGQLNTPIHFLLGQLLLPADKIGARLATLLGNITGLVAGDVKGKLLRAPLYGLVNGHIGRKLGTGLDMLTGILHHTIRNGLVAKTIGDLLERIPGKFLGHTIGTPAMMIPGALFGAPLGALLAAPIGALIGAPVGRATGRLAGTAIGAPVGGLIGSGIDALSGVALGNLTNPSLGLLGGALIGSGADALLGILKGSVTPSDTPSNVFDTHDGTGVDINHDGIDDMFLDTDGDRIYDAIDYNNDGTPDLDLIDRSTAEEPNSTAKKPNKGKLGDAANGERKAADNASSKKQREAAQSLANTGDAGMAAMGALTVGAAAAYVAARKKKRV